MRNTPLTQWHRQHQAKMMEFGGFLMPIEYTGGILQEHARVRSDVGMFDVSHMGEFSVTGARAGEFLDQVVTNQPSNLAIGQALYSPMCYPDGGTVDDLLVYRLDQARFMLVVNAGNIQKDWEWLDGLAQAWDGVTLQDDSERTGLIALQGPKAESLLQPLVENLDLSRVEYYHAVPALINGATVLVSRTGYTGEDGFELYLPQEATLSVWEALFDAGALPVGLGARDTLRLEARLPLYDHELTREITPLEAGLGFSIKWDKGAFLGREALWEQKSQGLTRKIVGLRIEGGIARPGYPVMPSQDQDSVGQVTSGTKSPTLGYAIALALVGIAYAKVGTMLLVEIRGRKVPATVIQTPFYKRSTKN